MTTNKKTATARVMEGVEAAAQVAKEKANGALVQTPTQAIGIFAENLPTDTGRNLKSLYGDLLAEFSQEGSSKVAIGKTLVSIKELLGENFGKFLDDCVAKTLRRSLATCYNYIALFKAANLKFAKNKVVADALFRIWDAKGCFDSVNGELSPAVDKAIKALDGIPESTDSQLCETWVRRFIVEVDKLVGNGRAARTAAGWDSETMTKKHVAVVKGFRAYVTNKSVSSNRAISLLTDVMVEALTEMSPSSLTTAIENAKAKIAKRRAQIAEDSNTTQAAMPVAA